jgi:hypothetical protein
MAQVAVCSQTNKKQIKSVWAERTIVKIFNLLVHPVTSGLKGTHTHTVPEHFQEEANIC